jgi:hypothetical protein
MSRNTKKIAAPSMGKENTVVTFIVICVLFALLLGCNKQPLTSTELVERDFPTFTELPEHITKYPAEFEAFWGGAAGDVAAEKEFITSFEQSSGIKFPDSARPALHNEVLPRMKAATCYIWAYLNETGTMSDEAFVREYSRYPGLSGESLVDMLGGRDSLLAAQ